MLLELFPREMHALESFHFLFALATLLHALDHHKVRKDSLCNSNTSWIPSWPEQLLTQGWLQIKLQTNFAFLFHRHSIATQGNQDLTVLEYEQRMAPQRSRVSVAPEVALKVGSPGHVVGLSSLTQAQLHTVQSAMNAEAWK